MPLEIQANDLVVKLGSEDITLWYKGGWQSVIAAVSSFAQEGQKADILLMSTILIFSTFDVAYQIFDPHLDAVQICRGRIKHCVLGDRIWSALLDEIMRRGKGFWGPS